MFNLCINKKVATFFKNFTKIIQIVFIIICCFAFSESFERFVVPVQTAKKKFRKFHVSLHFGTGRKILTQLRFWRFCCLNFRQVFRENCCHAFFFICAKKGATFYAYFPPTEKEAVSPPPKSQPLFIATVQSHPTPSTSAILFPPPLTSKNAGKGLPPKHPTRWCTFYKLPAPVAYIRLPTRRRLRRHTTLGFINFERLDLFFFLFPGVSTLFPLWPHFCAGLMSVFEQAKAGCGDRRNWDGAE